MKEPGNGSAYANFNALPKRANFPRSVLDFLKTEIGVTGMRQFLDPGMLDVFRYAYEHSTVPSFREDLRVARCIWAYARAAWGMPSANSANTSSNTIDKENDDMDYDDEDDAADQAINAGRNEMIALLQQAQGAKFVKVAMQNSRLTKVRQRDDYVLTFKVLKLEVKEGDLVLVQYNDRFGLGIVQSVSKTAPAPTEYDYSRPLRYVLEVIDTTMSKRLDLLDKTLHTQLAASEAQDRLERLTRQLGVSLNSIDATSVPSLPPAEKE